MYFEKNLAYLGGWHLLQFDADPRSGVVIMVKPHIMWFKMIDPGLFSFILD